MEACATAHHWAQTLTDLGHEVRLIAPKFVKPYVKNQKNDLADAEAIAEAASRPTMRFVEVKTPAQQGLGMIFRLRDLLAGRRTQTVNALRGHLAEFGIVTGKGREYAGLDGMTLHARFGLGQAGPGDLRTSEDDPRHRAIICARSTPT